MTPLAVASGERPAPVKVPIGGSRDAAREWMPSTTSALATRRRQIWTQGMNCIRWIEEHLSLTNARWVGKPFSLLPWQQRLLLELLECDEDGVLRHRHAYLSMGKKNGKTELAAAVTLWLVAGYGEPQPLALCAAATRDQANHSYRAMSLMCEFSPALSEITEVTKKEILVYLPGGQEGFIRAVASGAGSLDGGSPSVVLGDECHEWTSSAQIDTWGVLTRGGMARECPLNLAITTAGDPGTSVAWSLYQTHLAIRSGDLRDDSWYSAVWEAPASYSPEDPDEFSEGLRLANPSLGEVQSESEYRTLLLHNSEDKWRRYYWNQWVQVEARWDPARLWHRLAADTPAEVEFSATEPVFVGVDIARLQDTSAVVALQWCEDRQRWLVEQRVWQNPYLETDPRHKVWKQAGGLDVEEVCAYLVELYDRFPACAATGSDMRSGRASEAPHPGPLFSFDPNKFAAQAQRLHDGPNGDGEGGLNMNYCSQTDRFMFQAAAALEDGLRAGVFLHDGNEVLSQHLLNVVPREGPRGYRLAKPKGSRNTPVDGAVALCMAYYTALMTLGWEEQVESEGVYYFDLADLDATEEEVEV